MFSRLSRKQPVSSARRQRRPSLEMLEGRQLMSLGAEMVGTVNTTTRNAQFASDTATNFSGQTVVVWTDTFSTADHDIRAQRYNSSGGKVGSEIVISGSSLDESHPKVAIDGSGRFEVAWTQTQFNGDSNVVAQLFDANGVPRNNTPPLQVANTPLREYDPSIAVMPSGNFVVSYTSDFSSTDQDLFYKEYNSNGTQLVFKSVANTTASEAHSSIAISAFGTVDVAWEQAFSNTDHDIFLGRYSANGTFLGKNVISNSSLNDQTPSVSMDFVGDAVVVWEQNDNIAAIRVSAAGVQQGNQINIASSSAIELAPSVALRRDGGAFVVTYESITTSVRSKVAEVSAFNTVTTFDAGVNPAQAVSIDGFGNYFISATGPELDIHARRGFLSS